MQQMKLQKKYFELIKSGKKTIELRLFDDKRRLLKIGDEIEFSCVDNPQNKIFAKIINLYQAADFASLCQRIDYSRAGFTSKEDLIQTLENFYPLSQQQKYGVIGIELECCL